MRFILIYYLLLLVLVLPPDSLAQDTTALAEIQYLHGNILSVENDLLFMTLFQTDIGESLSVYDITDPNELLLVDRGFSAYAQLHRIHSWEDDRSTDAVIFDSLLVWCTTHSRGSAQFGVTHSGPVDLWGRWLGTDEHLWQIRLSDEVDGDIQHPGNMVKYGDYLILAAGAERVRIYDLSNPEQPELVNVLDYYIDRIVLSGDRLLVPDGMTLVLLDISNPEEVEEVGTLEIGNEQYPFSFPTEQASDGYVFLPRYDHDHFELLVLDLMADDAPVEVARTSVERELRSNYVSIWDDKLYIKDAASPYLDVYNLSENYEINYDFTAPVYNGNLDRIIAYENLLILNQLYSGVVIYEVFPLSVPDSKILTPSSLSLSFYPNPFNSTLNIDFFNPISSPITVVLYDINGRALIKEDRQWYNIGRHSFALDGRSLPSGSYFVSLKSDKFVRYQKV
ncbi:MAG: T9SS type A sorting domain-containing protein, partial [Calditrichaeota bacterium]|nr:T9SS type A sorting domain-containing protein [Calditrichota bacterium]